MRPLAEKLDQKRTGHKGFLGLWQEMHYRVEFFNPENGGAKLLISLRNQRFFEKA